LNNYEISIIIPIYNVEAYLKRCIESVLCQSFKDIEIILINDGSTDSSYKIASCYSKKDSRIKLFNNKNQGLSASRNFGIKKASADYIFFLDSDDSIDKNTIEQMYKLAKQTNCDIVMSRYIRKFQNDKIEHKELDYTRFLKNNTSMQINNKEIFFELISSNIPATICSRLYKKSLFIENNVFFPKEIYFEEISTLFKLHYYAKKTTYLNKFIYNWYINPSSISMTTSKKHIKDIFKMLFINYTFLIEKGLYLKLKNRLVIKTIKYIEYLFELINKEEGKEPLFKLLSKFITIFNTLSKEEIIEFKNNYPDFYYLKLFKLMQLEYYKKDILQLIPKDDKSFLSKYKKYKGKHPLSQSLVEKLKEVSSKKVIVYGAGDILKEIRDKIEKLDIEIIYIIDKNVKIYENYKVVQNLNEIDKKILYKSNILITSLSSSSKIKQDIDQYSKTNNLTINTIVFY